MNISSSTSPPRQPGTGAWESEGGSVMPITDNVLPKGIIAIRSVRYLVGQYSYSKLEDALAEYHRNPLHHSR